MPEGTSRSTPRRAWTSRYDLRRPSAMMACSSMTPSWSGPLGAAGTCSSHQSRGGIGLGYRSEVAQQSAVLVPGGDDPLAVPEAG